MSRIYARLRGNAGGDRGASAVEFAFIAPIFIVLVFGIINFGILLGEQLALNHAVREGARAAVVQSTGQLPGGAARPVEPLVRNAVNMPTITATNVAVTTPSGACKGDGSRENLTVTAAYPTTLIAPMPIPGLPSSFNLSATAVFRCEW